MARFAAWVALGAGLAACSSDADEADVRSSGGPDTDALAADGQTTDTAPIDGAAADAPPQGARCASYDPLRRPLYGDLHVHTALSLDANLQGTLGTPTDAYRFARGEEIGIQPYDAAGAPSRTVRLARPLDFAAVTDHAEFLGAVTVCTTPGLPGYDHRDCVQYREDPDTAFTTLNARLAFPAVAAGPPALCGRDGVDCEAPHRAAWQDTQAAAAAAMDPSDACSFTSFVGYEWSANPLTENLHRNVIFASEEVPDWPTSYFDAPYVEELWAALRRDCTDAAAGCDAVVIPHNSNLSNGKMFATRDKTGAPIDAAFAAEQASFERLVEVFQHKGDSECLPGSGAGDELCGFEKMPYNNLASANLEVAADPNPADFVRAALGQGLRLLDELGVNPYAFGIMASTDTHIAAPGAVSEVDFPGHGGAGFGHRDTTPAGLVDNIAFNPGGLAGVWAEENSRAIFAALKRRETFGTSGPRIAVRLFAGWSYPSDLCADPDLVARGYDGGVPMGGDLPAPSAAIPPGGPALVLFATRDPGAPGGTGAPGTPLARAQIIKGWLDEAGAPQFVVHDVATAPGGGATVDPDTCEPAGAPGADLLCAVWRDPDFDPARPAFYYARVLQDPTCRWATHACNAAGVDCASPETVTEGFDGCCDERFERTIQERAWTSPIWHSP